MLFRSRIPAGGGRRDIIGRLVGDARLVGFEQRLGGGEPLGVEAHGDIVTLLAGVLVALLIGEREPHPGLLEVLLDAEAAGIEDGEIVLAVAHAVFGGLVMAENKIILPGEVPGA